MEYPIYEFALNYEDADAVIERKDRERRGMDTLELCIMRRAIDAELMRLTGMEPDEFLDGMRRLMAPA